jgi:hypothetical protein
MAAWSGAVPAPTDGRRSGATTAPATGDDRSAVQVAPPSPRMRADDPLRTPVPVAAPADPSPAPTACCVTVTVPRGASAAAGVPLSSAPPANRTVPGRPGRYPTGSRRNAPAGYYPATSGITAATTPPKNLFRAGTMPDGDAARSGDTVVRLRSWYRNDPRWSTAQASLGGGAAASSTYRLFRAQSDISMANADLGMPSPAG